MDEHKKTSPMNIPSTRSSRNNDNKTKSTFELANHRHLCRMEELKDERSLIRRRSRSAPLSLEASSIAKELRIASDSLQTNYEERKKKRLTQRRSVPCMNSKRQSWPVWDQEFISEEDENQGQVFNFSQSYPPEAGGTSV